MTHDEHRAHHVVLHRALDELLADFLRHHAWPAVHPPKLPSNITLMELMSWSCRQTKEPDELEG